MTPGGVSTGTPGFFQLGKHSPVSLQLPVLRLGMLQDGDVGVGVFPEGEEVLRYFGISGREQRRSSHRPHLLRDVFCQF